MYYDTICMYICKYEVCICLFGYVCVCVCLMCVGMCVPRTTYESWFFLLRRTSGINSYLQNICQAL